MASYDAKGKGKAVDADVKGATYEEKDSAYFGYYSNLSHQAQMLQDSARTSIYQRAIKHIAESSIQDRVVMDVGSGNGILSLFAAQAGARRVYSVEASDVAKHFQALLDASSSTLAEAAKNRWINDRIRVVHSKMEDVTREHLEGTSEVDTIVSECLGVLLLHERMCESFIDARDRFLAQGGAMVPAAGTICLAPVEDKDLWAITAAKANWWKNTNFYGVDLTPLEEAAWKETFSSPIVGYFTPEILLTTSSDYLIDFVTVTKEGLQRFEMPVEWTIPHAAVVHALGGWFDLHFTSGRSGLAEQATPPPLLEPHAHAGEDSPMDEAGLGAATAISSSTASAYGGMQASAPVYQPASALDPYSVDVTTALTGLTERPSSTYLSTSPYAAPTHWQQVRFQLSEPLAVNKGQKIVGSIEFIANGQRSYDMHGKFHVAGVPLTERTCFWRLDRQVYC